MRRPVSLTWRTRLARWALLVALSTPLGISSLAHAGSNKLEAPKLTFHAQPLPLPDIQFLDDGGRSISLVSFKGKLVLLNLWATWCVPCREEMPSLDRLQARLGGPSFAVVPLSLDRAGVAAVRQFFTDLGIKNLPLYIDESGGSAGLLRALGIPTTLLVNIEGRELGRLLGPADWDSPEAVAMIQGYLNIGATASSSERGSQIAADEALYATHCASCHGKNLEGDPDWQSRLPNGRLRPPPHDDTGHTWHHPDPLLFAITRDGLVPPIAPEGYETDMPAFRGKLTDEEIWAVLAFIKSRWSEEIRAHQKWATEDFARK
jgi:mono/diheme cytochrome c family protein